MKKFTFRLETVLRVRQEEENRARRELMEAELEQREQEKILSGLEAEKNEIADQLHTTQEMGGLRAVDFASHLAYLQSLQTSIVKRQDELMRIKNVTAAKRKAVSEAQQQKKMIENLKEKQYLRWKKEEEARETRRLDEMATLRYARDQSRNKGSDKS